MSNQITDGPEKEPVETEDDPDKNQCRICTHHFALREDSESTGICDECAQDQYVKQQAVISCFRHSRKHTILSSILAEQWRAHSRNPIGNGFFTDES